MTSTTRRPGVADADRAAVPGGQDRETWFGRMLFGPPEQPRWARPGLVALLALTAVLYMWDLTNSGWANEYYSAAAQAGSQSWKALLFGSFDAGNAITVDKPPAALWVMGLSGRLLGFGQWAVLAPQALMGVASTGLLAATVRRLSGPGAGLAAGAIAASTPVAVLIFRFNNPDALLVLLLVAAAYCTVRAIRATGDRLLSAPTMWLVFAGAAVGFGFLTKMMQAFLILPGLGLAYLIAANSALRHRIRGLIAASLAVAISAGWYLALVAWWPADSRPYIGGSTANSLWQLAVDYNGLGRIFGGHGNPGSGGGGGSMPGAMHGFPGFSGSPGLTRLFDSQMGGEISWLLPAAMIGLVAGLWLTRRAPRTDLTRAAFVLWGGWLVVTGLTFSYMSGTVHPYYTVALAPAIGALLALSVRELWSRAAHPAARLALAAMAVVTGAWSFALLDRSPDWLPWLRWTILAGSILVAAALIVSARQSRRFAVAVATAGLLFGLGGTGAWAVATAGHSHSGGNPNSGPTGQTFGPPSGNAGGGPGSDGAMPGGASTRQPGGESTGQPDGTSGQGPEGFPGADGGPTSPGGNGPGGDAANNTELVTLLEHTDGRWAAAAVGSGSAATLALESGRSVMAIGGFTGGDNSPTLQQFQSYVAAGQVRYFLAGFSMGGGNSTGTQISDWVKSHFATITVGGTTVYDLSQPVSA
ncbi:glycosyltransferase family 39 protein [Nocardia niigatensis]|uniref:glycosyltransferase family 39 protein n=1 Tax=Nocardia niigatensis TaxID=209249 RepID=UPI0005946A3C